MPFPTLTTFIVNIVRRSLQVELNCFFNFLKLPTVTKQAFSQARKKLSPKVFIALNEKLVTEFYSDNEVKTFKGLRILAIDGSSIALPDIEELANKYGRHTSKNEPTIPLANSSLLFDVLNQITIHTIFSPHRTAEKDMAAEHILELVRLADQIKDQYEDLILFDRGYPSAFLIFFLLYHNKHFVMRCHHAFIQEVRDVIDRGMRDSIITISSFGAGRIKPEHKKYLPHITAQDTAQIRVSIFDLPNGNQEILLSSLLDKKIFTPDDIFMLYGKRWDLEEEIKFYKHITQMENFSGETALAIEQDFHATVLTCNMVSLLAQEAQDELEQEMPKKNRKYAYKVNRNIAIGTIKNEVIGMLLGDQDLEEYCAKIKQQMKRSLVPIRPGRAYPRPERARRKRWPAIRKNAF